MHQIWTGHVLNSSRQILHLTFSSIQLLRARFSMMSFLSCWCHPLVFIFNIVFVLPFFEAMIGCATCNCKLSWKIFVVLWWCIDIYYFYRCACSFLNGLDKIKSDSITLTGKILLTYVCVCVRASASRQKTQVRVFGCPSSTCFRTNRPQLYFCNVFLTTATFNKSFLWTSTVITHFLHHHKHPHAPRKTNTHAQDPTQVLKELKN